MRKRFEPWIKATLVRRELWSLLAVALLLIGLGWFREPLAELMDRGKDAVTWVQSFGAFAPLAYIALYILQIIIAPLPGNLVTFMGGYLFGTIWETLYSLVGIVIGALPSGKPRSVARTSGDQAADWRASTKPLGAKAAFAIAAYLAGYFDHARARCAAVAGLTQVPLRWLLLAVLLGRTPTLILSSWLGAQALALPTGLFLTMLAMFVVVFGIAYRYQRPLRLAAFVGLRQGRDAIRKDFTGIRSLERKGP